MCGLITHVFAFALCSVTMIDGHISMYNLLVASLLDEIMRFSKKDLKDIRNLYLKTYE